MQLKRWLMVAMAGSVLVLSGCNRKVPAVVHHPATLEDSGVEGIKKVRLEPRAVERTGIQTATVREEMVGGNRRLIVPYGAIMYDKKGVTWVFTNPEPLVYVRQKLLIDRVDGDRVLYTEGPVIGTTVVTVGAAELMGAEHKYGH